MLNVLVKDDNPIEKDNNLGLRPYLRFLTLVYRFRLKTLTLLKRNNSNFID